MNNNNLQAPKSVLQEYFSLINDASHAHEPHSRDMSLLRAWAVLRYILSGPMSCQQCQTKVRLAIPVISERFSGETLEYPCLCTNCTFKELERSRRIILKVGSVRVEYSPEEAPLQQ